MYKYTPFIKGYPLLRFWLDPSSTSFIYLFVLFLFALFMNQCSGLRLSQVPTVAGICLCVCPMQLVEVEDTSRQQASTSSTSPPPSQLPQSQWWGDMALASRGVSRPSGIGGTYCLLHSSSLEIIPNIKQCLLAAATCTWNKFWVSSAVSRGLYRRGTFDPILLPPLKKISNSLPFSPPPCHPSSWRCTRTDVLRNIEQPHFRTQKCSAIQ